jgi:transposase
VAVVAAARELACLFWCRLTRGQDYAYAQPSLTRKKLRRLELTAGHQRYAPEVAGIWHAGDAVSQAELAYQRTVRDWHAAQTTKTGAGATPGRASQGRQSGKQRGRASVPDPAL